MAWAKKPHCRPHYTYVFSYKAHLYSSVWMAFLGIFHRIFWEWTCIFQKILIHKNRSFERFSLHKHSRFESKKLLKNKNFPLRGSCFYCSGGETGIRTLEPLRTDGFQDRCIRPLCHLSKKASKWWEYRKNFILVKPFSKKVHFLDSILLTKSDHEYIFSDLCYEI